MSASKSKLIDKANEEAKKPVKKARPKREAEPVVIPVTIAPTVQPVQPQLTQEQIDALYAQVHANDVKPEPTLVSLPPLPETVATIAIPEPVVTETTPPIVTENTTTIEHDTPSIDKETVFQVWKRKGYLWWFGSAILFIIALIIYFVVQNNKEKKADKKTEQVQKSIDDQKGQLGKTETNLTNKQNSTFGKLDEERLREIESAIKGHLIYEANMLHENERLKKENEILLHKITIADSAALIELGRQDASKK